ncbi:MAG: heme ABC transporter permease [Rickettsiales bacterium]|nr:heme ABC transporter permease [Rickettsiales bacterium]
MHKYFKYSVFETVTKTLFPFLLAGTTVLLALGLYYSLFNSPADYQQGDTVRIMYLHVPAASMSLLIYTIIALASASFLIWKNPLSVMVANASAPIGAVYAFLCLVTGAIWGYPMWGAWWVWDARLTSMLILFFFYIGYILLYRSFENNEQADRMASILAVVGIINVPIVKFSVDWWNTLHQHASLLRKGGVAIDPSMMTPLLLMIAAFSGMYFVLMILGVWKSRIDKKTARIHLRYLS